jgi:hypothetical protein
MLPGSRGVHNRCSVAPVSVRRAGLEGALSWTQVYHAMQVIQDEASARRLDQVERIYDALRPVAGDQAAELKGRDGPRPDLSEEERVALEARASSARFMPAGDRPLPSPDQEQCRAGPGRHGDLAMDPTRRAATGLGASPDRPRAAAVVPRNTAI